MAYQNNIPQPTDQLSKSQMDILGNFQFLNTIASGIFDAPVQGSVPTITVGDTGLFTFLNATTTKNEMYLINSDGNIYPITASKNGAGQGWTYLPSGMKMVWGNANIPSTFSQNVINYSSVAGFPGFSTANIGVQLTRFINLLPGDSAANFIVLALVTQFQFVAGKSSLNLATTDSFSWLAIGL